MLLLAGRAKEQAKPDAARSPIGSAKDQLAATEARLARSERALRESEEQQARLQAELMKTSLSPGHSGGFASLDNARAQREAEKMMALQRRVAEGEARERQQATMQAKMEELLRLQEVALGEREESAAFRERGKKTSLALDDARSGGAFGKSYAALTAGVKRFLASRRADDADDRASNLVRLLTDAG